MLDKIKAWLETDLALPKIVLMVVAAIAIFIGIAAGIGSCRSHVENAGIQSSATKADKATEKAEQHEGAAQSYGEQADVVDAQRVDADKQLTINKGQLATGRSKLAERKKEYEAAKDPSNFPVVGGSDGERERRLLAKLRALYEGLPSKLNRTRGANN